MSARGVTFVDSYINKHLNLLITTLSFNQCIYTAYKSGRGGSSKVLPFFLTMIALAVFAHFENNEETKIKMSIFLMKSDET